MRAGFFLVRRRERASSKCISQTSFRAARAAALVVALTTAFAAQASTPRPPRRPDEFGKPAPAGSPSQATPGERLPADVDVNSLHPYNLPPASREKMHQCGDEWRKLKMSRRHEGLIWRSFAEKCLTR